MNRLAFALILLAAPTFAQDAPIPPPPPPVIPIATIDAPAMVPAGGRLVLLTGTDFRSKFPPKWKAINPKAALFRTEGNALIITEPSPGIVYKFLLTAVGDNSDVDVDLAEVPVQASTPPTPVNPPTPPIIVNPPAPVDPVVPPDVTPTPQFIGNMRVVILWETTANLTQAQRNAIWSTKNVLPYLNSHCIKSTSGQAEWRAWDQNTKIQYETPEWQAAYAMAVLAVPPMPKVVVFAGSTVVDSHAITTEDDLLAWLKTKGGP